ncbi:MAG: alkene reductase [Myxococcales bacterium]
MPQTPSTLFTPFAVGGLPLRSRIAMAPMTRSRAGEGAVPTPLMATYYAQRASAGLIITEATQVSQQGQGYVATPGIYTDAQAAAWRTVTDGVHAAKGRIFLQLWHVGRISHTSFQPGGAAPVAPSALTAPGETFTAQGPRPFSAPRALELSEIPGIVEQYAHGARLARQAGFDGVEVHGANGYLIDQFLRSGTNLRTDAYGGPVQNRARLLLEVVDAVAGVWGTERVAVRLSPLNPFNGMSDRDPEETFSYAARELSARRIAFLHLVDPAAAPVRMTPVLRPLFAGPIMVNGGFTRETAEAALARGEAQLVSFGVPFISNPDLPRRLELGIPLAPADQARFYGGSAAGYTDYPALAA